MDELAKLVEDHDPDIIMLCATKLRRKSLARQELRKCLTDYELRTSCREDTELTREGERTGAAGVAIAIHKRLARQASTTPVMLNSTATRGHCQVITLHPPGGDEIDIWAVYIPHDLSLRQQIHQVLKERTTPGRHCIMACDWNAAYLATDRSGGVLDTADNEHIRLLEDLQMQPTDRSSSSQHTYHMDNRPETHSRIDDFVTSNHLQAGAQPVTRVETAVTGDSHHYPLIADIPLSGIDFTAPGPEPPLPDRKSVPKWPATKQQCSNYQTQTEMVVGQDARQLAREAEELITQADAETGSVTTEQKLRVNQQEKLRNIGITGKKVTELVGRWTDLMKQAEKVAKETFEWTQGGPAMSAFRGKKPI